MKLDFQEIGKKVKEGALIIYPTDTVYGIAASIHSEEALKRLYAAKTRNFSSPLIALLDSVTRLEELTELSLEQNREIEALSRAFWPGALTIIVKAKKWIPSIMISGGETVGVRIPKHEIALELIRAVGGILPTSSANISGEPSPNSFSTLSTKIKERVDIVIDGGDCPVGEASTILDMTKEPMRILREGAIRKQKIEAVLGRSLEGEQV